MRQYSEFDDNVDFLYDNENQANRNPKKRPFINEMFEWLDVIVASVVAVVIIFTFLFRIVSIDGSSMENTLMNKERVIISNMFYEPKRGDIVVISRNTQNDIINKSAYSEPIIKRVIAVEGDQVNIDFDKGIVYVNGVALVEPYIKEQTKRKHQVVFPVLVPENCIFVMGDNRNDSLDSRSTMIGENGMINVKYVLGHAVLRIFPFNKFGGLS